ncbi:TolC family protein [bacterium]|nr:TolC family protein [bacterium]
MTDSIDRRPRQSIRWRRFLAGCILPVATGCSTFGTTASMQSPQRKTPLAVRKFTAVSSSKTPRAGEPVIAASTTSLTTIRPDVLPAGFETPPVAVGDIVEPGKLTDMAAQPIVSPMAAGSATQNRGDKSTQKAADSDAVRHREYVVARVEYVALTPPPAPAVDDGRASAASAGRTASDADSEEDFVDTHDLDLSTALQLVGGQNPQVAFAHQRIVEAAVQRDAAQALWLPSIRAGVTYYRHDGNLQNSNGSIIDANRSSLQLGFGARAIGAGTASVPGLSAQFHVSDAVFQPRIAERTLAAREFGSWVTYHDQMLRAAESYLELLRAHQELAIASETLTNSNELLRLTSDFARTGQGAQADADRAATETAIRQNDVSRAEEAVAVASARLAEVLHLDAPLQVVPTEQQMAPIELVASEPTLQSLVATGLSSRPEVGEQSELVAAACERLQREQFAPLMPSVLLGLSYGGFGGGTGSTISSFSNKTDFALSAVWEIRNLGLGDRAAQAAARAQIDQERFAEIQLLDRISREIVEARTQVRSRHRQIETARHAVEAAQQSYSRNRERVNEGQGLPIEFLQSLQALDQSRREYLRSVTDYNVAQFRLHHALGWPADAAEEVLAAKKS